MLDLNDKWRFVENGRQLFLVGYYPGLQVLTSGKRAEPGNQWYQDLIDALADNGVNLLRVVLTFGMTLGTDKWLYPYEEAEGGGYTYQPPNTPWTPQRKLNLDKFSQPFLQYWDDVVTYAEEKGVIVQACIFDGWHTKARCLFNGQDSGASACQGRSADILGPLGFAGINFDFFNGKNHVTQHQVDVREPKDWYTKAGYHQKAFVKAVVQKLKHHKNLIWEICNEPAETLERTGGKPITNWLKEMRGAIRGEYSSQEQSHLIMPYDLPGQRCVAGHMVPSGSLDANDRTKCSRTDGHFSQRDYEQVVQDLVRDRENGYVAQEPSFHQHCRPGSQRIQKPMISDNDFSVCSGDPGKLADRQRRKAWVSLIGGGYASLFLFNIESATPHFALSHEVIKSGMKYVGLSRHFIEVNGIELSGSKPVVPGTSEPPNLGTTERPVWALEIPNKQSPGGPSGYILYFFSGGRADLTHLKLSDSAKYRFFDPKSGTKDPKPLENREAIFAPSNDRDWALWLE